MLLPVWFFDTPGSKEKKNQRNIKDTRLHSVNRDVAVTSKQKQTSVQLRQFLPDGSEYPHTSLKVSFSTTKIAGYANKLFFCMRVRNKCGNVHWAELNNQSLIKLVIIDIIYSI